MKAFILLLIASNLIAALSDPGEGLSTQAARRTARVTAWQAAYDGLTAGQIANQARKAVEDMWEPDCLYAVARVRMGEPGASDADVQQFIEDKLHALQNVANLDFLDQTCEPPTGWTPATGDQGPARNRVLVISGDAVTQALRETIPVLPRVGSVPPLVWASMASGTCTIDAVTGPCFASQHDWAEAHLHLVEAIARSEGVVTKFALLPAETVDGEGVVTTWQDVVNWR